MIDHTVMHVGWVGRKDMIDWLTEYFYLGLAYTDGPGRVNFISSEDATAFKLRFII